MFLFLFTCSIDHPTVCREAHVVFKPGKNRDGYFDSEVLIAQVNCAIDIFECKTNSLAQGLFLFNNAPSHMKRASDAISATKMVKSASHCFFLYLLLSNCLIGVPQDPKHSWTHHPKGPCMHNGINPLTISRMTTPIFRGGSRVWNA